MRLRLMLLVFSAGWLLGVAAASAERITIGAEDDWYPYGGVVEGKARGYGIDIARAAFSAVNIETHFEPLPYQRCIDMARRGELIACLQPTRLPENEAHFFWSKEPLFKARSLIYARAGHPARAIKVKDLEGKSVAVTVGYEYGLDFDHNNAVRREVARKELAAFRMLDAGRTEFAVGYEKVVNHLLKKNVGAFKNQIVPVGEITVNDQYCVFSRRHPEGQRHLELFEKGLAIIRQNGTYAEIEKRYP